MHAVWLLWVILSRRRPAENAYLERKEAAAADWRSQMYPERGVDLARPRGAHKQCENNGLSRLTTDKALTDFQGSSRPSANLSGPLDSKKEIAARAGTRSGEGKAGSSDRPHPKRGVTLAQFVFGKPEEPPVNHPLPNVAAARDRDRVARARVAAGEDYKPSKREMLEARAWHKGGHR